MTRFLLVSAFTAALSAADNSGAIVVEDPSATSPVEATSPESPVDALVSFRAAQTEVLKLVKSHQQEALETKVDSFLDYTWIAQQSLGGPDNYAERCGSRCADFEAVLTQLIRENYLLRVRQADKGELEYLGQATRDGGQKAKVDTRVSFKSDEGIMQHIEIDYVMHLVDGEWQVRNMITDGVSLSKTYRYEFNRILKDGGIDHLIETLEKQVKHLKAKNG